MIWPKYIEEKTTAGVRTPERADGSESAGWFRRGREGLDGLKSVSEEAWMKPMFEALAAEMDGIFAGQDVDGMPSARWLRTLRAALGQELQNLRSAEIMLLRALPKMAAAAEDEAVREIFEGMAEQVREQAQRIDETAELMNVAPEERRSVMMEGLVMGIREIIAENQAGRARDASLLEAALKAQEYKAGCYGCARTFAYILGLAEVSSLLERSALEATATPMRLRKLADTREAQGGADWEATG